MNIYEKLLNIQNELKAPKGQYNSFGKYKYRSCEDILEAVKPICKKYKTTLILSDEVVVLGNGTTQYIKDDGTETETTIRGQRFYIKATATLYDTENNNEQVWNQVWNTAYAREDENKKGMDGSQITGTASSYARKYALNGLFNIDDTKDADTDEYAKQTQDKAQDEAEEKIGAKEVSILQATAVKYKKSSEDTANILIKYGYANFNEVKKKDYAKIGNELSK